MKYKFIVIQDRADFFRISWSDISEIEDAEYYDDFPCGNNNRIISELFQFHFSRKVRKKINLPLKSCWNPFFYNKTNTSEKPLCFIFSSRFAFFIYNGLVAHLRKVYPCSKFICFYQDIVSTHDDVRIEDVKKEFDLVLSYDKDDAKKYGLIYHPTVYSKINLQSDSDIPSSDVFFVGAAKDRLGTIVQAYDTLSNKGLKCDFYITGAVENVRILRDGIHYSNRMLYKDNVARVMNSKAILEILQGGAVGYSLRFWEAITYKKLFITNNSQIIDLKKNNPGVLTIDEITKNHIENYENCALFETRWSELINVRCFLLFIENLL